MTLTLNDISDRLRLRDELVLLELLHITSDELVDRFSDRIEELADDLEDEVSEII